MCGDEPPPRPGSVACCPLLAWLETVRAPLRGKWRRAEASAPATIGPSPPTASGVERAPLPLPYPGPGPQSAGFLLGIVDPGFRPDFPQCSVSQRFRRSICAPEALVNSSELTISGLVREWLHFQWN